MLHPESHTRDSGKVPRDLKRIAGDQGFVDRVNPALAHHRDAESAGVPFVVGVGGDDRVSLFLGVMPSPFLPGPRRFLWPDPADTIVDIHPRNVSGYACIRRLQEPFNDIRHSKQGRERHHDDPVSVHRSGHALRINTLFRFFVRPNDLYFLALPSLPPLLVGFQMSDRISSVLIANADGVDHIADSGLPVQNLDDGVAGDGSRTHHRVFHGRAIGSQENLLRDFAGKLVGLRSRPGYDWAIEPPSRPPIRITPGQVHRQLEPGAKSFPAPVIRHQQAFLVVSTPGVKIKLLGIGAVAG